MPRLLLAILGFSGLLAAAACNDPFGLQPASITNLVDTLTLYAVNGTPVTQPSALQVQFAATLKLDAATVFDFLYYIDPVKGPSLIPYAGVVPNPPTSGNSGYLITTKQFDEITEAEQSGYLTSDTLRLRVGQVFYVRSQLGSCNLGIPYYGKVEVLSIDAVERSLIFRILSDSNCGYRNLQTGLPSK